MLLSIMGAYRQQSGRSVSWQYNRHPDRPCATRISAYIRVYTQPVKLVKIRRVGNSNVVSIPHQHEDLGFKPDAQVMVTALPSGELRVLPVANVRKMIREYGRRVIAEDRRALQILDDFDQKKA